MQIIPVVDVQHGVAVRAHAGERASYRPLATPLAVGCDPLAVAQGLLALHPFKTLYVADLDGIEGRGRNAGLAASLAVACPGCEVWVDDGLAQASDLEGRARHARVRHVVGSETLRHVGDYPALREALGAGIILSLDFHGERYAGPAELLSEADLWPRDLIVMTLAQVGADQGPDVLRVREIVARAGPERRVFAAGGVRDAGDVRQLAQAGAAGVLVASALHAGRLSACDLVAIDAL